MNQSARPRHGSYKAVQEALNQSHGESNPSRRHHTAPDRVNSPPQHRTLHDNIHCHRKTNQKQQADRQGGIAHLPLYRHYAGLCKSGKALWQVHDGIGPDKGQQNPAKQVLGPDCRNKRGNSHVMYQKRVESSQSRSDGHSSQKRQQHATLITSHIQQFCCGIHGKGRNCRKRDINPSGYHYHHGPNRKNTSHNTASYHIYKIANCQEIGVDDTDDNNDQHHHNAQHSLIAYFLHVFPLHQQISSVYSDSSVKSSLRYSP